MNTTYNRMPHAEMDRRKEESTRNKLSKIYNQQGIQKNKKKTVHRVEGTCIKVTSTKLEGG